MNIGGADLAGAAVSMKSAQISQQKDIALIKKGMEFSSEIAQQLINQIAQTGVNMSAASGHIDVGA